MRCRTMDIFLISLAALLVLVAAIPFRKHVMRVAPEPIRSMTAIPIPTPFDGIDEDKADWYRHAYSKGYRMG